MSGLLVRVFTKDKAIETEGEIAFGEQVAVAVEFEDATVADASTMRLRVRHMNADVAVFPLVPPDPEDDTGGDAWTPDAAAPAGTRWTATLNLNTVQLRAAFGARPCDGASIGALLMVDCYDADNAALHALGKVRIRWWDADETISGIGPAPAPVDIGEWAAGIEERLDNAETVVAALVAEMPDKASVDDLSALQATVAAHGEDISSLQSSVRSNTEAIAGKVGKVDGKGLSTNDYSDEEKAKVANAVQSETGKGLSANDFTDALKAKLDGIEAGATNVAVDSQITEDSANAVSSGAVFDMKAHLHQKIEADVEDGVEEAKSYADSQIATAVSAVFRYKGSVEYYADLPTTGNKPGDVYDVQNAYGDVPAGTDWAWTEDGEWQALAGKVKVDQALDDSSHNPIANKAVADAIAELGARGYITISGGHIQAVIP